MAANTAGEQWVEIIEPQSREKMFANPITGEILFQPPYGAIVKPLSQNQWWELFDQDSSRNYYYNAQTGETIWEEPPDGADIIPLSKVQSTSMDDDQLPLEQNGHDSPPTEKLQSRKFSDTLNSTEIDPSSTENGDGRDFSSTYSDIDPDQRPQATQATAIEDSLNTPSPAVPVGCNDTGVGSSINDSPESPRHDGLTHNASASPQRVATPNSTHSEEEVFKRPQSERSPSHSKHQQYDSTTDTRENELLKSRTLDLPRGSKRGPRKRIGSNPNPVATPTTTPTPVRPAPVKRKSKSPSHVPPARVPSIKKTPSVDTALADKTPSSSIPAAPPFNPPKTAVSVIPLETFKDLETHRKGFLRKKVTIANMLCWTKDSIKRPMIVTRDKQQKKEACDLFKLVQQFMGDRKSKTKHLDKLALDICSRCWEKKGLRDELYIQLCRQTTANGNVKSLEKGWQLLSIALAFFPPTIKFRSYLEGFLWRHVEPLPQNGECPVEVYAQYCHKRVEKMVQSGAKRGLKKPSLEEVIHAKSAPFHPPLFGASLEEVMELQSETHPEMEIPWVISALCDVVLSLKGPQTEGIFRVPGDIDEVNALKLKVEKAVVPVESLRDPHVPASLLKLWFRELEEPLIPEDYYEECIANCDHRQNAISLVESLPDLNKHVLYFLLRFLKHFITADSIALTKMSLENIAMVWAPNFLRCPSDDHTLIFQNTRKEMAFLRLLLKHLDLDKELSP